VETGMISAVESGESKFVSRTECSAGHEPNG